VNPATVPRIKNLIRNVSYEDAAKIVEEVMEHTSAQTIEARAREVVKNVIAEPEVV
jgi:dihydroneopterin aldolase